jgi:hypothetical protein
VGVAPLTDAGCVNQFEREEATIQCPGADPIKCPTTGTGLWSLPLQGYKKATASFMAVTLAMQRLIHDKVWAPFIALAVIGNLNHPADLVSFHHTALWSPSMSTLETALDKQYLPPLPGLSKALLRKYRPDLEATTMGHLDSKHKNIQSTKKFKNQDNWIEVGRKGKPITNTTDRQDETADAFPHQDTERSNHVFLAASEPRHLVYSDQTGRSVPSHIQ